MKKWITAILLLFSAAPSLAQAEDAISKTSPASQQYNIIMIVLDTCRLDHLSFNGYQQNTSPNIDKLTKESIVFDQAIAQGDFTSPSFFSFLTSRYATSLCKPPMYRLPEEVMTLPQILKIYGYKTIAFPSGPHLNTIFGLNRGFDIYTNSDFDVSKTQELINFNGNISSMKEYISTIHNYLETRKDQKKFMLIHSNDMHLPYDYPEEYRAMFSGDYNGILSKIPLGLELAKSVRQGGQIDVDRLANQLPSLDLSFLPPNKKRINLTKADIDYIVARYDAGIFYADKCIGEIIKKLEDLGIIDKTIIIILADHGRVFSETHGGMINNKGKGLESFYVGHTLYDEVVRVPLIIRHPDISARHITRQVRLLDLMPTILGFIGIQAPHETEGENLMPLILNNAADSKERYAYAEANETERAIRTSRYKLIQKDNKFELYDLINDPGENKNLWSEDSKIGQELKQKLNAYYQNNIKQRNESH